MSIKIMKEDETVEEFKGSESPPLSWLQAKVGGNIEMLGFTIDGKAAQLVFDEDGRQKGLYSNDAVNKMFGMETDFVGNVILLTGMSVLK